MLNLFPRILDEPDVLHVLHDRWVVVTKELTRKYTYFSHYNSLFILDVLIFRQKKDLAFVNSRFRSLVLRLWPAFCSIDVRQQRLRRAEGKNDDFLTEVKF